jgi:hypothetical protein
MKDRFPVVGLCKYCDQIIRIWPLTKTGYRHSIVDGHIDFQLCKDEGCLGKAEL